MFGAGESHAQNKPSVVHPSISSSKPRLGACMPIACPTRHWFSASIGADGASLFVRSLGFFFPVFVSTKRLPSFAEKSLLFRTRRNLCQQSSPSPLPALPLCAVAEVRYGTVCLCRNAHSQRCERVRVGQLKTPRRRKPVECSAARGGSDPLLCVRAPSAVGTRAPLHSQGRYLVDPASSHMLVSKI